MDNEFRGVWIATVGNLDWPSKPGLPAEKQQRELLDFFDLFQSLGLNAVLFQARACCDAFYESALEPWSEFLTGEQGKAPGYDPLAFAIEQAHVRGLQLHAWINPFRARYSKRLSPAAANHVSRNRAHLVKDYGTMQWLDPGEEETQAFSLAVVSDILQRYAVDGLHIDDYFYPYRVPGQDFPDEPSWAAYGAGPLSRADWRRDNVNRFVERLWQTSKAIRPAAQFGISPFGIWRPGNPRGVQGLDAYVELYADALLWLKKGWADYFAPQLYWKIDAPQQSFPALLDWWQTQNSQINVWPGLYTGRISLHGWPPEEITRQIEITRERKAKGHIHFSARVLRDAKLQAALKPLYK